MEHYYEFSPMIPDVQNFEEPELRMQRRLNRCDRHPGEDECHFSPGLFKEIINARMLQRRELAEQRRREDLCGIERANAITSGIEPVDLFPKEIWKMILDQLRNPKDRGNAFNSHDLFRALMESTRIHDTLFPQILQLDQFVIEEKKNKYDRSHPLEHLLKIRLLSKSLRALIDRVIEENLERVMQTRRHGRGDEEGALVRSLSFSLEGRRDELQKLDNLADMSRRFGKTTFFLKSLYIFLDPAENPRESLNVFSQRLTSLLELIGDQVWSFECNVIISESEDDGIKFRQLYICLQTWISLMPKLRWMKIGMGLGRFLPTDEEEDEPPAVVFRDIRPLQSQYPFPTLSQLEEITFALASINDDGLVMCEVMLAANTHIKSLAVECYESPLLQQMPQGLIRELELTAFATNIGGRSGYLDFFMIEDAIDERWPLSRLHLTVDMHGVSINYLFRYLEKFPSLEYLTIHVHHGTVDENINFLTLPNLKEFECVLRKPNINYDGNLRFFCSFQFLIFSANVRKLVLENYPTVDAEKLRQHMETLDYSKGDMIDFWKPDVDLKKSNIWDVFPNLEYFKVKGLEREDFNWKKYTKECKRKRGKNRFDFCN